MPILANVHVPLHFFNHSQEAECDKTLMDAKFEADTKVADSERMYKMSAAAYQKQVNTAVSLILL